MADPYNEKVMQHFLNPKNVGEIKDADGIGKVGNPVCVMPSEKVHKNSESLEISKLEKNHRVLTHSGNYEEIINTSQRVYSGKVIKLKNKLGTVNLTPEHLIYALSVPKGDRFLRNAGKKKLIPSWHHSEELKKGDIILYPILKKEEDINFLEINIPKFKWDFRSNEIPKKIALNSELLRLFGYFLAEGNIQNLPSKTYISFTLNLKEEDIAEDIKNISKKIFNLKVKIKKIEKVNTLVVYIYNAKLARYFKSLFGNYADNKKIPDFIMNLPKEKQKALIYGLWKGDGYVSLNRKNPRAGYSTISYQLLQQIKILLLRQKIVPSIYTKKEKRIKGVNHKISYRIHVGQRDSLIKLCSILCLNYSPKSHQSIKSWFDDDYMYTPITKRKMFDYSGFVNNLEVKNTHSFVSEAFCLHNCGDIMWVYIKVGKDKKGEEIIEDVKFKTLGCAAAIATSSMITELSKGRTLGWAMNISKMDIAAALEGLPPIKMHCSNLAAEALHSAILDYFTKKGDKEMIEKYSSIKISEGCWKEDN